MTASLADELSPAAARAWLGWLADMGVGEADLADWPLDPSIAAAGAAPCPPQVPGRQPSAPPVTAATVSGDKSGVLAARRLAVSCHSMAELEAAVAGFDGCTLRHTATRLCFGDGNPMSRLMLIGEAPGNEEDRQGRPFVGPSGQLLDRMLATIGLDRTRLWITNLIFWRPPGNRAPTAGEIAVCQPFLERQIEILAPRFIVFLGGIAARVLLGREEGVTRLRGQRYLYRPPRLAEPVPALVMFHPAFLLRQPLNKRYAWRDLLTLRAWLAEPDVSDARGTRGEMPER